MRRLSVAVAMLLCAASARAALALPLPPALTAFATPQGQAMFLEARARTAYWPLSAAFETQSNQAFCGVASLVMVLNSLPLDPPVAAPYAPYRYFTQDDVFDPSGPPELQGGWIAHHGLTLDQLAALARQSGLRAELFHAAPGALARFRTSAAAALAAPGDYVLVNFSRQALGEQGYGHISPLAAYDAKTDRFLLLDVARYKYAPAWVPADLLYAAMDTPDHSNDDATRGFVILSLPAHSAR